MSAALADDWGDVPARVTSHDLDAFERAMGDAPTYEAARDAAVDEIQRRMDNRMAVL